MRQLEIALQNGPRMEEGTQTPFSLNTCLLLQLDEGFCLKTENPVTSGSSGQLSGPLSVRFRGRSHVFILQLTSGLVLKAKLMAHLFWILITFT